MPHSAIKFYIFPWKITSESAKLLTSKLGGTLTRDMDQVGRNDIVINWGWGNPLGLSANALVLNRYPAIRKAIDKLETFRLLVQAGVPTLAYTESHSKAVAWSNEGNKVYGRSNEGCDGEGLMVYNPGRPPERHSFYTKGFPTHREFRINVAFGQAIDITEKKRRIGTTPNPDVRTGEDWVYCRNNLVQYPGTLADAASRAVTALGLDFGGVDVGLANNQAICVFEVNTAPWLGSLIAEKYALTFKEKYQ